MTREYFGECQEIIMEIIPKLNGSDKRIVLAKMVEKYGDGGQTFIAKKFNIGRDTIRKGMQELSSGIKIKDAFDQRGRKKAEEKLLNLLIDIKDIADGQCQTDPKFDTTRLYTRLTAKEIRNQLIKQKGYTDDELPTKQTLNTKMNELGFTMRKVQKTKPLKKIKETDAIFDNLENIHKEIENDDEVVRLSFDAKDRVKVGNFSRGGKSRVKKKANDHDFVEEHVTPFGIMNVKTKTVEISIAESKITADYIADRIGDYWDKHFQGTTKTLLINGDNGPENSSRRTQFIKRMVDLSIQKNIKIILAYYPPYHSKYNPIERVWGVLEQHWNGDLLDSKNTIIEFAKTMTYKDNHPEVTLIKTEYKTGITLDKETMAIYESVLERKEGIEKWFVTINPSKAKQIVA
jgi:transposase